LILLPLRYDLPTAGATVGTSVAYSFDTASRLTDIDWNLNGTTSDFSYDFTYTPSSQTCPYRKLDSSIFMMQPAKVRG